MAMFGFGMGGINASVFPSIALAVPSNMTTLAFAGVGAMLNASMVFFPYFTGTFMILARRIMCQCIYFYLTMCVACAWQFGSLGTQKIEDFCKVLK